MKIFIVIESGIKGKGNFFCDLWEANTKHFRRKIIERESLGKHAVAIGIIEGKKKNFSEKIKIIVTNEHAVNHHKINSLLNGIDRNDVIVVGRQCLVENLFGKERNYTGRYRRAKEGLPFGWVIALDANKEHCVLDKNEIVRIWDELTNIFVISYDMERDHGKLSFAFQKDIEVPVLT